MNRKFNVGLRLKECTFSNLIWQSFELFGQGDKFVFEGKGGGGDVEGKQFIYKGTGRKFTKNIRVLILRLLKSTVGSRFVILINLHSLIVF